MAPPVEVFPANQLQDRVQVTTKNRRRKKPIDLKNCDLMEMVQYSCEVEKDERGRAVIKCEPLVRLFRKWVYSFGWRRTNALTQANYGQRRCADGLSVEVTALERDV